MNGNPYAPRISDRPEILSAWYSKPTLATITIECGRCGELLTIPATTRKTTCTQCKKSYTIVTTQSLGPHDKITFTTTISTSPTTLPE